MNSPHRVVLVSDMHYTTEETHEEMLKLDPRVNTSAAAGDAFGYTQREKVECVYRDILAYHRAHPLDAALVLGDLSIDDYDFRNLPENYCAKFKRDCMDRWPFPAWALAGNHDSYPDDMWAAAMGTPRQYSVRVGGAAFIMLDTFRAWPANGASGSACTGVDVGFLRRELEKYPEGPVFLCAHYIRDREEDPALADIVRRNGRIVCAFRGHTHVAETLYPASLAGRPLADIGGYGYMGEQLPDGRYSFARFDPAWAWGFEALEWDGNEARLRHISPPRLYRGGNGVFDYPGCEGPTLTLPL